MKHSFLILVAFLAIISCKPATPGHVDVYDNFSSKYVLPRTVRVWVPENYSSSREYAVLYMHDGQALYDSTTTWNHQEWGVDEMAGKLIDEHKIKPCIIVGIDNTPEIRGIEYMPQRVFDYLPTGFREQVAITRKQMSEDGFARIANASEHPEITHDAFLADKYLRFIVKELKPFIDKTYSTSKEIDNTVIMGSSMGGLISLYAICEYPEIFGRAACLSIHSPMVSAHSGDTTASIKWNKSFADYLNDYLPYHNSRFIYMDHGDQTLDALYPPYQARLDKAFTDNEWTEPYFVTKVFPGKAHCEKDWAERLDIPLVFLLGK